MEWKTQMTEFQSISSLLWISSLIPTSDVLFLKMRVRLPPLSQAISDPKKSGHYQMKADLPLESEHGEGFGFSLRCLVAVVAWPCFERHVLLLILFAVPLTLIALMRTSWPNQSDSNEKLPQWTLLSYLHLKFSIVRFPQASEVLLP